MKAALALVLLLGACRPVTGAATPVSKTGPILASTGNPTAADPYTLFRAESVTKMLGKVQAYLEQQDLRSTLEADGDGSKLLVSYSNDQSSWTCQLRVIESGGSERAVQVRIQGNFFIDLDDDGETVLELLNAHHKQWWGGTFSLDDDGEVLGRWPLNLPSAAGLHATYVHDVIIRLGMAWRDLREALLTAGVTNLRD